MDLIERLRDASLEDTAIHEGYTHILREAAAALEAAQQEGGRVVGSRKIDDVHVIVANAFTPGAEEQLLVRYDHYLTALEAAREDAFRLDEIKRSRLAVTPVEGGGWDVTVFGADDYKETLLGSGADMRAAIDEAIDQARGKGGQEVE